MNQNPFGKNEAGGGERLILTRNNDCDTNNSKKLHAIQLNLNYGYLSEDIQCMLIWQIFYNNDDIFLN